MQNQHEILNSPLFKEAAENLAATGRFLAARGWSPATSSNYSTVLSDAFIAISCSGVDKYSMSPDDVLVIDRTGDVIAPYGAKSSAETLIHTAIYKSRPEAKAVLHTHSPTGTRLSLRFLAQKEIRFAGYEMQKGLSGNSTHESTEVLPIMDNAQDMIAYSKLVESLLTQNHFIHGFLIAGHGLYTWGRNLKETRRHIEAFEFLMSCMALELSGV